MDLHSHQQCRRVPLSYLEIGLVDTAGEREDGMNRESSSDIYTMCTISSYWGPAVQHREPRLVLWDDLERMEVWGREAPQRTCVCVCVYIYIYIYIYIYNSG